MLIFPKLMHILNIIPISIPAGALVELDQLFKIYVDK